MHFLKRIYHRLRHPTSFEIQRVVSEIYQVTGYLKIPMVTTAIWYVEHSSKQSFMRKFYRAAKIENAALRRTQILELLKEYGGVKPHAILYHSKDLTTGAKLVSWLNGS